MRQAEIYRKDILAGILTEEGGEYRFCYDEAYLAREDAQPVSLTLPLQTDAYVSPVLFPFFDGLIPEGWLLDVALRNTDISILDRMSLLLLCCKECVGSVSVVPIVKKEANDVQVPVLLSTFGRRAEGFPSPLRPKVLRHKGCAFAGISA